MSLESLHADYLVYFSFYLFFMGIAIEFPLGGGKHRSISWQKRFENWVRACIRVHIPFRTAILWQKEGIFLLYTYMKGTGYYD